MVTKSNAWWMTSTKGIYLFNISPFRQRAFAGFGREMANMVRLHWKGAAFFWTLAASTYCLTVWAEHKYRGSLRKDPAVFEQEAASLQNAANSAQ